jgi:putative oxidoreductase
MESPGDPDDRPVSDQRAVTCAEDTTMDIALLILRVVVGASMAAHGAQKLFGWFGGPGVAGVGAWFESIGFRPGMVFALLAGLAEVSGGVLFAVGFLGPFPAALMLAVMVVAIVTVHLGHGFFAANNGVEVPLLYITGAVVVAFAGPGMYSLDQLLGLDSRLQQVPGWLVLAIGLVGALGNLALRRPAGAQVPMRRTGRER